VRRPRRHFLCGVLLATATLPLATSSAPVTAATRPTVLVVVTEKVMGVFDTTGFEEPRHVETILAAELDRRGLAVVDLETVQRSISRARARQLLEGDEITAREVALQEEAEYLLLGTATSKPAGTRLFGTNMQSLQANVSLRIIRNGDGQVLGGASAQASEAHLDEVQGGILALTEATGKVVAELDPVLRELSAPASSGPGNLSLQVEGMVSFRHLDYLMGFFLRDLPGVDDARLRGFHGGVAEIDLSTASDAEGIARAASSARFTGFRLRVTHVTQDRIEMEAVLEE